MLRVLAVDDEVPALEELLCLLRADPRVARAEGASDAATALRRIGQALDDGSLAAFGAGAPDTGGSLDVVFMDIRMPGMSGLETARLLTRFQRPPLIVFVTAHEEFAVRAFDLEAVDYVLKPVRRERLAEAVRRVSELVDGAPSAARGPADAAMIPVELGGVTRFVHVDAVTYAEAHGDYTRLHTGPGTGDLVRVPLSALEERWHPRGFVRVHRRFLVALWAVRELRVDAGNMSVLVGGDLLSVSRRHARDLRDLLARQVLGGPFQGVSGGSGRIRERRRGRTVLSSDGDHCGSARRRTMSGTGADPALPPHDGPPVEVLSARDVPLGGPRAMTVRRTLPQRARTTIGAWCFVDHYGPDDVADTGGMVVPPHPHTGLQTVSWLFSGEIEHRDSLGTHALVRPGELNLMTGGLGISHSEVSTPSTTVLHGVQLWVALPEEHRRAPRDFRHHVPRPVPVDGGEARVFLGSLAGETSPVPTFTPLLGAELTLAPRATTTLVLDARFEHGLLVDRGEVEMAGTPLRPAELGHLGPGNGTLSLRNTTGDPARMILLGGTPFDEPIVMWWNFVGRTHEDIVRAREEWQEGTRFGEVRGYDGDRIPAPQLPSVQLKPRGRAR